MNYSNENESEKNAEINARLFEASAALKKKSIESEEKLEDLKKKTEEILHQGTKESR